MIELEINGKIIIVEYSSIFQDELNDIVELNYVDYKIEDSQIIFIASMRKFYENDFRAYKIGQYNMNSGYGRIITKKGMKEYKNLKSLCKATEKFVRTCTFDYSKVLNHYKEYQKNNK